jgi:hypothetical protein
MRSIMLRITFVFTVGGTLCFAPGAALAHQHREVAGFETTVGWLNEPAYAGFLNGVQLSLERPVAEHAEGDAHSEEEHAEGRPVENAKLQVEVIFGEQDGTQKIGPFELRAAFGAPGEYNTTLIPTNPGTYTFHIFGTVGRTRFDEFYTSGEAGKNEESEGTYNDVGEPDDIEFPLKPPSNDQLQKLVETEKVALAASVSSVDDSAGLAMWLAIAGLVLGAAALLIALMNRKASA